MRRYFHVHMSEVLATLKAIGKADKDDRTDMREKSRR
jgi:hypothetical protein